MIYIYIYSHIINAKRIGIIPTSSVTLKPSSIIKNWVIRHKRKKIESRNKKKPTSQGWRRRLQTCSAKEAGREQSYTTAEIRDGLAPRERRTNYNNGEGHEYLKEWQLWLCYSIWCSFQAYKEGIIVSGFLEKWRQMSENLMVTQANEW